ncbi:MAG: DNA-binding protein, partial [bacterium]
ADVGLGIEAAAGLAGCSFLPLRQERFDLVIRKEPFFLRQVQDLVGLMRDPAFQEMSASLAGYDTRECGRLVG